MVSPHEIDQRFQKLPRIPGYRCFANGISKISQWSIKDARDIERYAVAVAAGRLDHRALRALRAELDFIYTADWEQISEEDLEHLDTYNKIYHANKSIFIDSKLGGRKGAKGNIIPHFRIPKLHARMHLPDNIRDCGASRNFSAQITERYHIDVVKDAYAATNRRDVAPQMVAWLNRQERVLQFDAFLAWDFKLHSTSDSSTNADKNHDEGYFSNDSDSTNNINNTITSQDNFHSAENVVDSPHRLNKSPALSQQSLSQVAEKFEIPQLEEALQAYLQVNSIPKEWQKVDVWYQTSIKLPQLPGDEKPRYDRILARPGTGHRLKDKKPRFHTVLVDRNPESNEPQDGLKGRY
jgi:hypothetical protein